MNYRILFKLLSIVLLIMAMAFIVCIFVAYIGEPSTNTDVLNSWFISLTIPLGLSLACYVLGRNASYKIFRPEALCLIGISWITCSIIGAIPYWMILPQMSFIDAIFEATSGLTTTGASVISNAEGLTLSLKFWRCFSQWIGGLGIVLFFVAILSSLGVGAKILYSKEASGESTDIDSSRVQKGIARIMLLYAVLTSICVYLFYLYGMNIFDAICHSFTTLSTGGFSNYNNSMAHFDSSAIHWITIIFMVIGGTSFFLFIQFLKGNYNAFLVNTEFRSYLCILVAFIIVVSFTIFTGKNPLGLGDSIRVGAFQVASIITTTGFSSIDYNTAAPVVHIFLMLLMCIGSCSGSTAGGVKIIRVVLGIKVCINQIEKAFRPHVIRTIRINEKPVERGAQESVLSFLVLALMVFSISILTMAVIQPTVSLEGSFSAILACLFNIGPGLAELGPTQNYAFLTTDTKVLLSLLMIMGRLEFFAILVLFFPSLWKGFN